jgi:hypothetical protein
MYVDGQTSPVGDATSAPLFAHNAILHADLSLAFLELQCLHQQTSNLQVMKCFMNLVFANPMILKLWLTGGIGYFFVFLQRCPYLD